MQTAVSQAIHDISMATYGINFTANAAYKKISYTKFCSVTDWQIMIGQVGKIYHNKKQKLHAKQCLFHSH